MLSALQGQPGTVTLGQAFLSATSMQKVLSPLSRPPLEHRSKGTGNSLFCAPRSAVCCDPSPHRCPTRPDFPSACYLLPGGHQAGSSHGLSVSSLEAVSWRPDLSTSCFDRLPALLRAHHRQGSAFAWPLHGLCGLA